MIYNHVTYTLSELDMRMVKSIPQGGNWKNIPLDIPSKRLDQIRRSGGRTTLYGRLRWDRPSYTISTYFNRPGNGTYIHPEEDRVISAREAARLQSFPDDFRFYGSKTTFCKQIGNAVPPLLGYLLAREIKKKYPVRNAINLFCGAGGLSLGFKWAGFDIEIANDIYKPACETYQKNFGDTKLVTGDITKKEIKYNMFNNISNRTDIVIGGPPCQGFSYAGKRLANDPRNFLFLDFVEIVKKMKPKVILVENVEGILTSNDGQTLKLLQNNFKKIGYNIIGKKIKAYKFGVPQKRKRVILIGVLKGDPELCFPTEVIKDDNRLITVRDAISNLPKIENNIDKDIILTSIESESDYQRLMAGEISPEKFLRTLSN